MQAYIAKNLISQVILDHLEPTNILYIDRQIVATVTVLLTNIWGLNE